MLSVYFTTIDIGNPPYCISAIHMNSGTVYNIFEDTIRYLGTPVIYTFLRQILETGLLLRLQAKPTSDQFYLGGVGFFCFFKGKCPYEISVTC